MRYDYIRVIGGFYYHKCYCPGKFCRLGILAMVVKR